MGCALETFEEILNYLHREHVAPMFACSSGDLKAMEQRADDTGCSLNCISHNVFGLEMGELLVCQACQAVDEV